MITGKVIKRLYAPGSKSERDAVMLATPEGEFLLRREGGNPFRDEALEALVGKTIRCRGRRTSQSVIMDDWEIDDT